MTRAQLEAYDKFLDENDWDIYYWSTQRPPTSSPPADAGTTTTTPQVMPGEKFANIPTPNTDGNIAQVETVDAQEDVQVREPSGGEWASTTGNVRPAYRPVPERWQGSEILGLVREHVQRRSVNGDGEGMAFMPDLAGR